MLHCANTLRAVQRVVGHPQDRGLVLRVLGVDGDADAAGDVDLVAVERVRLAHQVRELLGEHFCSAFHQIKDHELRNFEGVISSWERDHLLLKV